MDVFDIATGARFSKYKGLALMAGAVDLNYQKGLTFIGGSGNYYKNPLGALSDALIQFGIGSRSNAMPFLQEAILETVGGAAAIKISDSW